MDEQKRKNINSLMVQSYFDGELKSEDLEGISRDDLVNSEMYRALDELRRVVRTESELALDDVDGFALLDAINSQIDAETKPAPAAGPDLAPLSQPRRRTSKQFFQRWAPALIGVALFLLSVPGLIHWIAVGYGASDPASAPQPQTVVVIDGNGSQHQPATVSYQNSVQVPAAQNANSQLTVEEMDFAIRHLIKRIETLENHLNGVDSGAKVIGNLPLQDGSNL